MTVDPTNFLDDENWHGGYYELAVDLGERADEHSDERLSAALRSIWNAKGLTGCYLDRRRSLTDQRRVDPALTSTDSPGPLYGLASVPDGSRVVCVVHVIREESENRPHDWLDFCLPLGSLARVDDRVGAYPFEEEEGDSIVWRRPIDEWLGSLARRVFDDIRFRGAIIGFEVSGSPHPTGDDREGELRVTYVRPGPDGLVVDYATR